MSHLDVASQPSNPGPLRSPAAVAPRSVEAGPRLIFQQNDEVHVWIIYTDRLRPSLAALIKLLDADETEKARRFHFIEGREQFIVSRGIVRQILSRYTGLPPVDLMISRDKYGKPALDPTYGGAQYAFNISHTRGLLVCAVGMNRRLGVDIEYVNPDVEYKQIVERLFSSREISQFRALPVDEKLNAFFACWTRKEAYIKAQGTGFFLDFKDFDIDIAVDGQPSVVRDDHDRSSQGQWSLTNLDVGTRYAAALATEGKLSSLKYFHI